MPKFVKILKKFPRTFWVANIMELFERWAWYGMFMLFALYLTGSTDTGALGFTQAQKGMMMGSVVGFLYFLPVITGAIADRIGYKKVLIIAYTLIASSYFLLGRVSTYESVFAVFIMLALGAALFKPIISACVAKTTDDETSSMGFGIFYMIVNIGAFVGPIVASLARQSGWVNVFNISAGVIVFNMIIVLLFFKEPEREESTKTFGEEIKTIFRNIIEALKDLKFVLFLLIIVGFWTMYNQLFYTLPVFIDQWMDTSVVYDNIYRIWPWLAEQIGTEEKTIAAEMLTNIDAMYIIIFQLIISYVVMKMKPIHSMISGFIVSTIGLSLTFITNNPMFLFISILIFGLGEMAGSPKITEYIGKIAPPGKTALYMGCSFLPMAGGNFFAGILSGSVYQKHSDKITLLKMEVEKRGLDIPEISDSFSQTDYINRAGELMNLHGHDLTVYLWNTYQPYNIWMIFAAIGGVTVVAMILFNWLVVSKKTGDR
ncbi:MAG: MFS transporter [Marinilabiliales bacterium]|nr:MAG: MFS transporter [Marinilabiliales bacterium]